MKIKRKVAQQDEGRVYPGMVMVITINESSGDFGG